MLVRFLLPCNSLLLKLAYQNEQTQAIAVNLHSEAWLFVLLCVLVCVSVCVCVCALVVCWDPTKQPTPTLSEFCECFPPPLTNDACKSLLIWH